jgi:hypothetical protein
MLTKFSRFLFLLLPLTVLTACSEDNITQANQNDGPPATQTRVAPEKGFTLLLTDAPGDFKAAVVTIDRVYLQGQGGRTDLVTTPKTFDLISLKNSVATLVSGLDVPAGTYNQLRLVISGAYIEVEEAGGGTKIFATSPNYAGIPAGKTASGTLQTPSWDASGLKIDFPGSKLEVGAGQTIVMIDFDVKESFGHEAGKSGKWILHPTIKASNVTFGGNVVARLQLGSGVTLPAIGGQPVTLAAFSARLTPVGGGTAVTVVFSDANNDGIFEAMFKGLLPGQYTLSLVSPAGLLLGFTPTLPVTVTVSQNQTTTQTITLSSAALPSTITATLRLNTGVTLPMVGGAQVRLAQFRAQLTPPGGGAPVIANFTDFNDDLTYEASFPNLPPGTYSLTVLAPTGVTATYSVTLPVSIALAGGTTSTQAIVINAATSP